MPRISTFDLDGTINNSDKLIGTDSSDGTTKNFNIQSVKEFVYAGISGDATISSSGSATVSSNQPNADTLTTPRNIGGVSFNGSADIDLPGVNTAGNQNTSGNAATATKLASAATIGGVSFDGSSNINLPGVNTVGNQNTTGSAATLTTSRNIGGVSFDGSGNIDLPGVNTTGNQNTTGSAATLTTSRTIGGVSFDGSGNIDLPGVNTSGNQDTSGTAAIATTITVADESSDTTCFPVFVTAATGNLAPKSGSNLAFNSSSGALTAANFVTTSDKRLKSEIQPIKEGLEVIKKFSSYSYIKGGEKESGFIAQEVKEVIPHAVYKNNDGYLSMSDRSVLAHMHKAILELEEKLVAIEEKLK